MANVLAEPNLQLPINIPHVLLGLNLGSLSLGFDLFFEYGHTSSSNETTNTEASGTILNPGLIASLLFGSENPFAVKFGFSIPYVKGRSEVAGVEVEVKSEGAFFLEGGVEAVIPLNSFNLDLGTDMRLERYSFEAGGVDGDDNTNLIASIYFGADAKVLENGVFGIMYDIQLTNNALSTVTDITTHTRTIEQFFRLGLENVWENVWLFDKVAARGGATWSLTTNPIVREDSDAGDTRSKPQTMASVLVPSVGVGVSKGLFELDVTLNPAAWGGVLEGPDVGAVTATLRF